MILPTSIPAWQKIISYLNTKSADLKLNVDPFNGKHGGTLFYKNKSYFFKLEVFPKNMILSLKNADIEIFDLFSEAFEFEYSVIYKTNSDDEIFNIHAEWYYKCTNDEIADEINKLKNTTAQILKINKEVV